MQRRGQSRFRAVTAVTAVAALTLAVVGAMLAGTGGVAADNGPGPQPSPPVREQAEIHRVKERHAPQLLTIPGVVGVGVGACGGEPCIKVLLETDRPEVRQQIPTALEGFKVEIEVTGPILPLGAATAGPSQGVAAAPEPVAEPGQRPASPAGADDSPGRGAIVAPTGLAILALAATAAWRGWAVRRRRGGAA